MFVDAEFKDAAPEKTLERIQEILSKYQIPVEETWYESGVTNCYSMRVSVKDAEFGANGKGVTKAFARASGYAELMERMQAGYLNRRQFRDNLLEFNDSELISAEAFKASCGKWCEAISKGMSELFCTQVSAKTIENKCYECDTKEEGYIRVLPFYDVTDGCMTRFPQRVLPMLYNTNGLAAGNTLEEAFVQGFSEIIERQNVVKCFFGNIVPPTIPEEYLKQYEKSYETIQFLKEHCGLDIIIKDCSLGEPYPLVAAIAIDKKSHGYHVHMGAHPVFEIALERCLTEMFQGRTLSQVTATSDFVPGNTQRSISELISLLTLGCGRYPLDFFVGTPSYDFKEFPDRSTMTNAQLLREITQYVKQKGHHMLVRSVSHLGFPSVRIVIPGMSELFTHHFVDRFPGMRLLEQYKDAPLSLDRLTPEQLMEYRMFLRNQVENYGYDALYFNNLTGRNITAEDYKTSRLFGRCVHAYVEWYFDRKASVKYARSAIADATGDDNNFLSCLCATSDYLASGAEINNILSGLGLFYEPHILEEVRKAFCENVNPFARFLVHCTPDDCKDCRFAVTCNYLGSLKLTDTVRAATATFDNTKAFDEIVNVFSTL